MDGAEMSIETQVYVQKIMFDYGKELDMGIEDNMRFAKQVQFLANDNIKQFIKKNFLGGMDYIIRLTILALYKNRSEDFGKIFSAENYQQMLKITDINTLRFRQETSIEQNQNFDEIVNAWWDKLTQSGEIEMI